MAVQGHGSSNAIVQDLIQEGREILYDGQTGLHPISMHLLDLHEDVGAELPYREAVITSLGSRAELYASGAGGLAVKFIVGRTQVNTEENTVLVPHGHFVSMQHTLTRTRRGGGSKLYRPPGIVIAGAEVVDERSHAAMKEYLDQYIPVARMIRDYLITLV
ncbi:hypothetical protein KC992_03500 [Candidatus Saccharibacteria bacterium]|nr:hypothetical protein [Candidatus Saccharibacteria bacterium]MCA9328626.1 hypothetical protein [Candidatus Saccharibacteria bacterium]